MPETVSTTTSCYGRSRRQIGQGRNDRSTTATRMLVVLRSSSTAPSRSFASPSPTGAVATRTDAHHRVVFQGPAARAALTAPPRRRSADGSCRSVV